MASSLTLKKSPDATLRTNQALIRYLKLMGFKGPYTGGKHQFMLKEEISLRIPNPHQNDIGKELLIRILRQAGIDKDEWENL